MPTKAEVIAYANDVLGLDVDGSMTKADIEAAIYEAGYDPNDMGEDDMAEADTTADVAEEVERTSSDAAYSTYTRVDQQREGEINPPPGPQSQQTRGVAAEAAE
jgi:hypothetical protein